MNNRNVYILTQIIWGLPQTIIGFVIYLYCFKRRHYMYKGCVVTDWRLESSLSLGLFVFVAKKDREYAETLVHEYGHTIQSLMLGPLYLLIIGFPSLMWAGLFEKYRKKKRMSYFDFYTEKWANKLGDKYVQRI